jgi:hypothetical protein
VVKASKIQILENEHTLASYGDITSIDKAIKRLGFFNQQLSLDDKLETPQEK